MPQRSHKVLFVAADATAAAKLQSSLLAGMGEDSAQVAFTTLAAAPTMFAAERPDVLFVDLDVLGAEWLATLAALRHQAPGVPLIAIGHAGDETQAIAALQAGAQDCLSTAEVEGPALLRAVRYAIERSRFQLQIDDASEEISRERELGNLSALSGPPALPVSQRSLGATLLTQYAPQEFDDLVRRYSELLDRALLGRSTKEQGRLVADLNDIADRLGMLGAGPRDVVDLHKAAITGRIEGESARKSKAYVEEGRLLLVQLMGHLVSHYRSLSWGRGPVSRMRGQPDEPVPDGASAR